MFNHTSREGLDAGTLSRMMSAIRHRGPDGSGQRLFPEAALGFVRLSFIDLAGGMQPIDNEDGTVTVAVNGEVFNYQKLREDLTAKRPTWR